MSDLILAALILTVLSLGIFALVARVSRRFPPRLCDAIAVCVVLLLGFYIRDLWDNVILAQWLPVSSLIVLGNWFPLGIAVLAGVAWNRVPPPLWRKCFIMLLLLAAATASVATPFLGEVPHCDNEWSGSVCLQTTPATCSAACAATLLRRHNILTTEQEMAELCVTRKGTSWLGLFRGLKLKTAGTPWDVEVFRGDVSDLRKQSSAAIVFVLLTAELADRNLDFERNGWIAGMSHSVVLIKMHPDGECEVGDPSSGIEYWPRTDLELLYQGRGMRLVPRVASPNPPPGNP